MTTGTLYPQSNRLLPSRMYLKQSLTLNVHALPLPSGMKPRTPTLPEHMWSNIAQRMTYREWAMVCGTCQATFAVKLKLTRVSAVPSNLQEVRWLAKHCPSVEVVRLHMADGSGAAELQAIETCNPAASFDRVRQLGVSGNHSNLPEWVFWIHSHSSNLQLLKLDCISLPLFPLCAS